MEYTPLFAPGSGQSVRARLIVCEQRGVWAAWLRRELEPVGVRLTETRLLDDCWQLLAAHPASFLVLELTSGNVGELARRLAWLEHDYPEARAAVVADRRLSLYEWLMREAGAVHFLCSPREVRLLAELACPGRSRRHRPHTLPASGYIAGLRLPARPSPGRCGRCGYDDGICRVRGGPAGRTDRYTPAVGIQTCRNQRLPRQPSERCWPVSRILRPGGV